MRFDAETDRIYLDTPATTTVTDAATGRVITVAKQGSASTVVWNPWIDKAAAMADFGDDEYTGMVCVETCNIRDNTITLAPACQPLDERALLGSLTRGAAGTGGGARRARMRRRRCGAVRAPRRWAGGAPPA